MRSSPYCHSVPISVNPAARNAGDVLAEQHRLRANRIRLVAAGTGTF